MGWIINENDDAERRKDNQKKWGKELYTVHCIESMWCEINKNQKLNIGTGALFASMTWSMNKDENKKSQIKPQKKRNFKTHARTQLERICKWNVIEEICKTVFEQASAIMLAKPTIKNHSMKIASKTEKWEKNFGQ